MQSINPYSGEKIQSYQADSDEQISSRIQAADKAFREWRKTPFAERAKRMQAAGRMLHDRKDELAELMADEMGKTLRDGVSEIEKCAVCCDYYAEHSESLLASQTVDSDATESYVAFDPLGVILAVMPWNFPFWQVFRFTAPSLMAGNAGVLKHASNVCGCALAIQELFEQAGFPAHLFSTLLIESSRVEKVIRHPLVRAVTLTGSAAAGRSVATLAGSELKKTVLELGGSDAYIVLEDADLERAVQTCVQSRLINAGQSCIAAKRFIVVKPLYAQFEQRYVEKFKAICYGDPKDEENDIGPLARTDLRDAVHRQVQSTIQQGGRLLAGGEIPSGPGACYPATVLGGVKPGMTAFDEEVFGPVAAIVEADDEAHAIALANQCPYGLGAAIFTEDPARANRIARDIEAGSVFVNALVKSDVRLPFGGVKQSGYGRELSAFGIREFVNIKTVWHAGR